MMSPKHELLGGLGNAQFQTSSLLPTNTRNTYSRTLTRHDTTRHDWHPAREGANVPGRTCGRKAQREATRYDNSREMGSWRPGTSAHPLEVTLRMGDIFRQSNMVSARLPLCSNVNTHSRHIFVALGVVEVSVQSSRCPGYNTQKSEESATSLHAKRTAGTQPPHCCVGRGHETRPWHVPPKQASL